MALFLCQLCILLRAPYKKAQDTNLPRTHTIRHRDHQRSHQRICHLDVFGLQTQLRLSSSAFSVSSYASVKIWFTLSLEIPKKSHYISDGIQLANISVYIYPGNFFTREKIRWVLVIRKFGQNWDSILLTAYHLRLSLLLFTVSF